MTPEIKKLPLDLTAEAISNRIDREVHVIEELPDGIFPLASGIFYKKGLLIRSVDEDRILQFDEDYALNYHHEEVTRRSGFGAYAVVVVKDETIKGTLEVTYQAVGGEYTRLDDALAAAINDINVSESIVYWHNIRYKPLAYPPEPHHHSSEDLIGMDDVVEAIDGISSAIKGEHPEEIERLEEIIATKVSNLNYTRYNQVNKSWELSKDTPLRISARPFPSVISVEIDLWLSDKGYSGLAVSGELTADGKWLNRSYLITKGELPEIEVQLFNIDGTSAEVLIRSTGDSKIDVVPNVVRYLKHRPEVTSLSCLDLDTITIPIPDEDYEVPKAAWA